MIIGLFGYYCSGKDTVAAYLTSRGMTHYSLSDEIRAEAQHRNITPTRENLINLGNELRKQHGNGILAKRVLAKIQDDKDYVINSIRNIAEVEELKKSPAFILLHISAPLTTRYERDKQRKRAGETISFEEFVRLEEKEKYGEEHGQHLSKIYEQCHDTITNDSIQDTLHERIDRVLAKIEKEGKRLNWDEYFMHVTKEIGKRGTCARGRTGCIIVKDKRILATGYAGSPSGLPHCDDIGHLMTDIYDKEGNKSSHCIRTTHAEQNALAQAARFGISLDGATLYCKMEPCHTCAKMIINAGIKRVVAEKQYHKAELTRYMLQECGTILEVLHHEVEQYEEQ